MSQNQPKRAWRHHVNGTNDKQLTKITKNGETNTSGHLDDLQNVGASVEHGHHGGTGILDEVQDMVL